MHDGLIATVSIGCGLLVLLGLGAVIFDRPLGVWHLGVAAVVELGALVQAVLAAVELVRGASVDGLALFVAYLVFSVVVLPAGALWAVGERNRWSGAVLAVAALALVVTLLRMDAVWLGRG